MTEIETTTTICSRKGCGHSPFPISVAFLKRARRTHETFYCPAGHSQWYPGESDIERLELKLKKAESSAAWFKAQADRNTQKCPWVQCYFMGKTVDGLGTHLRAAHGMPTQAEVTEDDNMEAAG